MESPTSQSSQISPRIESPISSQTFSSQPTEIKEEYKKIFSRLSLKDSISKERINYLQELSFNQQSTYGFIDEQEKYVELNEKQILASQMFLTGYTKSLFLTGSAGVGKSVVLKYIYKTISIKYEYMDMENKNTFDDVMQVFNGNHIYMNFKIQIIASTGVAASQFEGAKTIHSLFIYEENKPIDTIISKYNIVKKIEIMSLDVLLIDEISMVSNKMFTDIDNICRKVRNNNNPFGGISVLCFGDFSQLPPVVNINKIKNKNSVKNFKENKKQKLDENKENIYCFQSKSWEELFDVKNHANYFLLDQYMRQLLIVKENLNEEEKRFNKYQSMYIQFLENLRKNKIDLKKAIELIKIWLVRDKKTKKIKVNLDINDINEDTTIIYSTNYDVNSMNEEIEKKLICPGYLYESKSPNNLNDKEIEFYKKKTNLQSYLSTTLGMRVILLKNTDIKCGLVNGSIGYITGYNQDFTIRVFFPKIKTMVYPNKENEMIENSPIEKIVIPVTKKFYEKNNENYEHKIYVEEQYQQFHYPFEEKDINKIKIYCDKFKERSISLNFDSFTIKDVNNVFRKFEIIYTQPLRSCYAMTVYKVQSQSLPEIIIEPKKLNQQGQLYTAFSRCIDVFSVKLIDQDLTSKIEKNPTRETELIKENIYKILIPTQDSKVILFESNLKSLTNDLIGFFRDNLTIYI